MDLSVLAAVFSAVLASGAIATTVQAVRSWLRRDRKSNRHVMIEIDGRRIDIEVQDPADLESVVKEFLKRTDHGKPAEGDPDSGTSPST